MPLIAIPAWDRAKQQRKRRVARESIQEFLYFL